MEARDWATAADAWEAAATEGHDPGAAWEAAGECWRRDDRPRRAVRALQLALGAPRPDAERASLRARLAGSWGELGQPEPAEGVLLEGLATAEGPARALLIDTWVGHLLGFGRKEAARPWVERLVPLDSSGLAVTFRRGQLARLDGDLDEAERCFQALRRALEGQQGAEAGAAAAAMEVGEVEALRGHPLRALGPYEEGRRLHERAGRRALAWRCEAGRVRAAVQAGLASISPLLDEGLMQAEERGMRLLQVDLWIARGMARASTDPSSADSDLGQAQRAADAMGARLRAGRARLERAQRCVHQPLARRRAWCVEAVELLADHVVLRRRAEEGCEGVL
jgi:tetratricopeptide (TPR) repeat protein